MAITTMITTTIMITTITMGRAGSRMVDRTGSTSNRTFLPRTTGIADVNRKRLNELGVLALNLVSSPGAGKTSLLTATATALRDTVPMAVIEGDQETENDAKRIRETGIEAVQINTGRVCHLDGHMIGHAMADLNLVARARCCLLRMSATSCVRPRSIWANTTRSRSCR